MNVLSFIAENAVVMANRLADVIRFTARGENHKLQIILDNIEKNLEKSLYKNPENPSDAEVAEAKKFTKQYLDSFSNQLFEMDWYEFKKKSKDILHQYNINKK